MNWTENHIADLKKKGKIRDFKANKPKHQNPKPNGKIVGRVYKQRKSKEKDWMAWQLFAWCNSKAVLLKEEYQFHPTRKYRADWAIEALRVLIEYEGLNSAKSGHLTFGGYSKDTEKYSDAAKQGWIVLRYTMKNYKNLIKDLDEVWDNLKK